MKLIMKKWHRIVVSLLASLLLATALVLGTFSYAPPAHAGTNGQQIALLNCSSATNVHIHGTNQSQLPTDWYPQNGDLVTHGFWWVGPVTVTYFDTSISQQVTLSDNVPQLQDFTDFYPISCPVYWYL